MKCESDSLVLLMFIAGEQLNSTYATIYRGKSVGLYKLRDRE